VSCQIFRHEKFVPCDAYCCQITPGNLVTQQTSVTDRWIEENLETLSCTDTRKCTYSELGTSMLLAMKPQFTRITIITNILNNVLMVKEIHRLYRLIPANIIHHNTTFWAILYFWPGNTADRPRPISCLFTTCQTYSIAISK